MALHHQLVRAAGLFAGKPPPGIVKRGIGLRIGRHIPGRHAGELLQAEIGARFQPHDIAMPRELRDEGNKQLAIEPVLVEIARRQI